MKTKQFKENLKRQNKKVGNGKEQKLLIAIINLSLILIFLAFFLAFFFSFIIEGTERQKKVDCYESQRWAKKYHLYTPDEEFVNMCKGYRIIIKK